MRPGPLPAVLLLALIGAACGRGADTADPRSADYAEAVAAFYRGVAALQVGETGVARASFQRFVELAPDEPAGWADLGLVGLQRRELEEATDHVETARRLAPGNARIELLSAILARERGDVELARERLLRTVQLDSTNRRALYLLAQITEQENRPGSQAEALRLINRILAGQPENGAAWIEAARLAIAVGDEAVLGQAIERLERLSADGTPEAAATLRQVRSAVDAGDTRDAATLIAFLDAALQPNVSYAADREALVFTAGYTDLLQTRFLRLPAPPASVAAADDGLSFVPEPLVAGQGSPAWVRAVWLSEDVPLAVMAARPDSLWIGTEADWAQTLAFPGHTAGETVAVSAVAAFDYDHDFRIDLALAGPAGLRIYRQDEEGSFADVTGTVIPAQVARGAYAGVWSADLDMEGDLDLVLGAPDGLTTVLRNRGDGSFELWPLFDDVSGLRDFVWADLDGDGTPDAALLSADGQLRVLVNQRSGTPRFEAVDLPDALGAVHAITAADMDRDGRIDLVLLLGDGRVVLLSRPEAAWQVRTLVRTEFPTAALPGARLFAVDIDNNGGLDLVASANTVTRTWLSSGSEMRAGPRVDARVTDVGDLSGEGRLDLLGVGADGSPRWFENRGTRDYYSVTLLPRATSDAGDRRINSFGTGGEIEVRAALLYQKQSIRSPTVHFGLGEHTRVDVARIVWPNGSVQAEFNVSGDNQATVARQRLKGSCPWVFAWDGQSMRFVTDFLWRTALGLRINSQGNAAVIHSEDWIRIAGDRLAARDGFYDLRITAELWETHFFDHVALMAVDHPAGTEVFVDERFTLPAPEPVVRSFAPLRPVTRALDHEGRDVTDLVRAQDGRYLDSFDLGPYQGIAHEHFVEADLGDDAMEQDGIWLIAQGWVYPTDSSINFAIGQGGSVTPHGLQLEVPDGRGGWTIVQRDLGFPAGKTKTVLIDLGSAFVPGTPRRVRLRTNMEIYWDRIAWAVARPESPIVSQRLLPAVAELQYRGFSEVTQAGRTVPELPDYDRIGGAAPQWLDLVGYHTRFGDVRTLIGAVDDRYVIMNAGDELILRFPALPPPPDGWTRDFVLIGDGWVKDGDFNTGFSRTVLPLPYHGLEDYGRAPGRLEDDPAYRRHPEDWKVFHTRYVTPRGFQRALVPDSAK